MAGQELEAHLPTGGVAGGEAAVELVAEDEAGTARWFRREFEAKRLLAPRVGQDPRLLTLEDRPGERRALVLTEREAERRADLPLVADDVTREP